MARRVEVSVEVSRTGVEIAAAAAEFITGHAEAAVAARGVARLAISGGSTPKTVFALLADASKPYFARLPWNRLELFWVDERCVGPADAESNYGMTRAAMLDKVPLPAGRVHRMEGELDPEQGASRYESEIRNAFKLEGAETPVFDLVMLGLGPDGHTASLFPHTEGLQEMARIVIANHVAAKDAWRLTLTWPVIVAARVVAFLVEGKEKTAMVRTVWAGAYDPETYPAQMIRPLSGHLTLLLDEAAAADLPGVKPEGTSVLELA